jgi:hypothetical protein
MTKRSVAAVIILSIITFGIYQLVWTVKTKGEMNQQGANIPTAWFIIVPVANIWWMWKWAGGVEHVTKGKTGQAIAFILLFLLGFIGAAIIQDGFNKSTADMPQARVA